MDARAICLWAAVPFSYMLLSMCGGTMQRKGSALAGPGRGALPSKSSRRHPSGLFKSSPLQELHQIPSGDLQLLRPRPIAVARTA